MSEEASDLLRDGTVTITKAVGEFGVSRSRLYEWMASGELPYTLNGTRRLIPREAIRRLLAKNLTRPAGTPA